MTKPTTPAAMGRKGGKARMATLTAQERQALARKAGKASGRARRRNTLDMAPTKR